MRSGFQPVTSRPASVTSPVVGARSPESRLVSVDLPAPFGPITAWMRSRQRPSETSLTEARPTKRVVATRAESSTSLMAGLLAAQRPFQQSEQAARREGDQQHDE